MLTLRDIYDQTVAHMRSMPGPAVAAVDDYLTPNSTPEKTAVCKYRGEGGSRCAVGYWIPDDRYTPEMEDVSLSAHLNPIATGSQKEKIKLLMEALPPLPHRGFALLVALQKVHDQVAHRKGPWDMAVFEEDLRGVREEFRL